MAGSLARWRYGVVGAAIAGTSFLALTGLIGDRHPERYDARQVTVRPDGVDGVRIREVLDVDFGSADRHGIIRTIPLDGGVPTDVSVTSPDAPADWRIDSVGSVGVDIRIGVPDSTVTGQHRYVLEYTLPAVGWSGGELALDIVGAEETMSSGRVDVALTGFELVDTSCSTGTDGATGGCTLVAAEDSSSMWTASVSPLPSGHGLTVGGAVTGAVEAAEVPLPALPDRRTSTRSLVAALVLASGLLVAGVVWWVSRRLGRDEVAGEGAVEAAFGSGAVRRVTDRELMALATTDVVPPDKLQPWEAQVLLREHIDDETVAAWWAGAVGAGAVDVRRDGDRVMLVPGGSRHALPVQDDEIIRRLFAAGGVVTLGRPDVLFAKAWRDVVDRQWDVVQASGWWRGDPFGQRSLRRIFQGWAALLLVTFLALVLWGVVTGPLLGRPWTAVLASTALTAATAWLAFRPLRLARSAAGSALTIRVESFRRFLAGSEGAQVEWAWSHGLVREYSGWAAALGCAEQFQAALEAGPHAGEAGSLSVAPLVLASSAASLRTTHTVPSSNRSSSSGSSRSSSSSSSSSSRSVGGGRGGGSSRSW